jgi:hypothetical protein
LTLLPEKPFLLGKVIPQYCKELGRLKWKDSQEFESLFGINLSEKRDLHRHITIVEYSIMNVLQSNPKGVGIGVLGKMVGIYRANLKLHLKRLIERGYVKKDDGLRGKYFPTEKIIRNPVLSSVLMAKSFASHLLGEPSLILSDLKINPNQIDFRALLPSFEKEEFGLFRVMFEFASQIGAYILYFLIQAMNKNNNILKESKYLKKDSAIQEVVKLSIAPIVTELLSKFKDTIRIELSSLKGSDEDPFGPFIDYGMSQPEFQLPRNVIDEVSFVYSSLFPNLFRELEKIRKKLPFLMLAYDYHKEYLKMNQSYQKNCKHVYVSQVFDFLEIEGRKTWMKYCKQENGRTIVHCIKCHHTTYEKYVKNCQDKSYENFLK